MASVNRHPKQVEVNGDTFTVYAWTYKEREDWINNASRLEKEGSLLPLAETVLKYAGDQSGGRLFKSLDEVLEADGLLVEFLFAEIIKYNKFTTESLEVAKKN